MKNTLILNALVWAAVILIASYLFKDANNNKYLFMLLISGAAISQTFLTSHIKKNHSCCKD
ncbi:hypothetical protein FJ651_14625 [Paucihalobacter ruber]|uniref:Uncharacterized protein n=1 Tax=Paucihalobacter ruber TaxID=2567861 RepID=A0A506PD93_9FLAO|nr:hypothetical protein [Paucihalobacter ruber]TPV31425.1 hypothetical protein FJ651_14625 [Paucihalobacter ruber]